MKLCSKCKEIKSLDCFSNSKSKKDGKHPLCKPCDSYRKKQRRINHPHLEKDRKLLTNFGLTPEAYDMLLKKQRNCCAICGLSASEHYVSNKKVRLCVDHCHITGDIRGLLCYTCNRALGLLKDNTIVLSKAVKYLNKHKKLP